MNADTLPELVQRDLDRALPRSGDLPREVRIEQVGEMRLKPRCCTCP
jgi:hypothetical protein